ncbi:propanediol utilization protein [Oceanibium sediminis]|uniref:propanediol utilization protein n=1 Tax=Oceanibium sediminis TaxID=2026339 RepID=UPI000DD40D53|nr:propanediol utilization protein [Oceanibium sediminis]
MPTRSPVVARVAGHFGELLQGLSGGEVVLLTLPCPALGVTAAWERAAPHAFVQTPELLPEGWLGPIFRAATGSDPAGRITLNADLRRGGGCGGSTAAIVALARVLGLQGQGALAALCHRLEGASDPLMLDAPGRVLWASRRAEVVAELPPPPPLEVIGGHLGPAERTRPDDRRFADVADLVAELGQGVDTPELARIASTSALRNAALRRPGWLDPVERVARDSGALGLVAAHTGSACGLLFAPGTGDAPRTAALLAEAGLGGPIHFQTPGAP